MAITIITFAALVLLSMLVLQRLRNRQAASQITAPIILFTAFSPFIAQADPQNIDTINNIAANEFRSEENRQRNQFRHPGLTLDYFGIEPHMSVTELWPGKGWYTEILAPYLKDEGQLTIANFRTQPARDDKRTVYYSRLGRKLNKRINDHSDYFGTVFEVPYDPVENDNLGAPSSQDMVLIFRNIHNWDGDGVFKRVIEAAYDIVKPGGILGIVEHRANSLSEISSSAAEGYTDEGYVIKVIESVGFKLTGRTGINNNPKDTKNYPRGVYSLPPTFAMGDIEREKYLAIGESDRMTLKFIKPE